MSRQFPVLLLLIEQKVAKAAGLTIREVRSGSRKPRMVRARHAVWFAAKKFLGMSASFIAELYERDHTTILSAIDNFEKLADADILESGLRASAPEVFMVRLEQMNSGSAAHWNFGEEDLSTGKEKGSKKRANKPPEIE